ncbi:MAG: LuxR C-terminal-related transcriptional regulator [Planctomycetota bacterium]
MPAKLVQNHFLVFTHKVRLTPLLLNDSQNSFEIFSIDSTAEFVSCFQSQRPGCLITDTNNDFFDYPNVNMMSRLLPVIMVTNSNSVRRAADAARKGAHTVLRDFSNETRVRDSVRSACFADAIGTNSPSEVRVRINQLTTKERQVIYMSIRGKTTKMISNELNVCHQTVDKHKKRGLSKLKSSSVVDLMNTLMDCQRRASGVKVFETGSLQGQHARRPIPQENHN